MTTLTATFDGFVFKPDTKPDLSPNTKVRLVIESEDERSAMPPPGRAAGILRHLAPDRPVTVEEMNLAIRLRQEQGFTLLSAEFEA